MYTHLLCFASLFHITVFGKDAIQCCEKRLHLEILGFGEFYDHEIGHPTGGSILVANKFEWREKSDFRLVLRNVGSDKEAVPMRHTNFFKELHHRITLESERKKSTVPFFVIETDKNNPLVPDAHFYDRLHMKTPSTTSAIDFVSIRDAMEKTQSSIVFLHTGEDEQTLQKMRIMMYELTNYFKARNSAVGSRKIVADTLVGRRSNYVVDELIGYELVSLFLPEFKKCDGCVDNGRKPGYGHQVLLGSSSEGLNGTGFYIKDESHINQEVLDTMYKELYGDGNDEYIPAVPQEDPIPKDSVKSGNMTVAIALGGAGVVGLALGGLASFVGYKMFKKSDDETQSIDGMERDVDDLETIVDEDEGIPLDNRNLPYAE